MPGAVGEFWMLGLADGIRRHSPSGEAEGVHVEDDGDVFGEGGVEDLLDVGGELAGVRPRSMSWKRNWEKINRQGGR